MFRLDNRIALITGAATGIGQMIAITLAKAGAHIALADKPNVSLDETEELCQPYGAKILKVEMDVCDLDHIRSGVAAVA